MDQVTEETELGGVAAECASKIFHPQLLEGEVILVTGGGTGIGRAISAACARLGARVFIGGRRAEPLTETCEALNGELGEERVAAAQLNLRDEAQAEAWVAAAEERWGKIDALVNNAGGQFPSPALQIRPKGWRAVIDTNLNGSWWVTQAAGRRLCAQRSGRVISIVANMWRGFPGMAHTGAARAAIVNLTKSLALEWARHRVLVNAVAPGVIQSSGLDNYPPAVQALLEKTVPEQIPLGALGTVEDVAAAVVYLLSPAGRYLTGETLCVDGGQQHWGSVFPVR